MKIIAVLMLVAVAGCARTEDMGRPNPFATQPAPVPLMWAPAPPLTFDAPIFRAPGATMTCMKFGNMINCY